MTEGVFKIQRWQFGKTLPDEQSWKPILCALLLQSFSCLYLCLPARARLSEQPVSKALDACSLCGATERFIQSKKKRKNCDSSHQNPTRARHSAICSGLIFEPFWKILQDPRGPRESPEPHPGRLDVLN